MIDVSQETKQWMRDQGVAIAILCVVLYGAYELFERQRESHERQVAAFTVALDRLGDSYQAIDKRLGIMSVDLEFINGRSQRTLRRVKDFETADSN